MSAYHFINNSSHIVSGSEAQYLTHITYVDHKK